ncbi:hypothetical protein A6A27_11925 [Micromonospora sp. CB01531]|nr:hypothetical protein A6A27_11925 [Micromonospora sp. CB01531]
MVTAGGGVAVALIGVLVEILRRQHKRLGEVRDHVANSHTTNLRDDVDRVLAGLNDVKTLIHGQGRDIAGLREEIRHERTERLEVERRLDQYMAR